MLKTFARRSQAVLVWPVVGALLMFGLFSRGVPWAGEWSWTIDWANGLVPLLAPIVAGVAAHDAMRYQRASTSLLLRSTERPLWRPLLLAGAVPFATGLALWLLALGVASGVSANAGAGGLDSRTFATFVPVVAALGLAACIGVGCGVWVRNVLAGPFAAALVFALTLAPGYELFPPLFRVGGSTGTLVGLTWGWGFISSVTLTSILATASVACWLAVLTSPLRSQALVVAAAVMTLGAIAIGATITTRTPERLVVSDRVPAWSCRGTAPEVCLDSRTDRSLIDLSAEMAKGFGVLRGVGITAGDVFRQVVPGNTIPQSEGPLFIESVDLNQNRANPQAVIGHLLTPSACPMLTGETPPPAVYFEARDYFGSWLAVALGTSDPSEFEGSHLETWVQSPDEDWLRSTYEKFESCDLQAITVP